MSDTNFISTFLLELHSHTHLEHTISITIEEHELEICQIETYLVSVCLEYGLNLLSPDSSNAQVYMSIYKNQKPLSEQFKKKAPFGK